LEAAKAYALCNERHKVAEMHILEAGRRAVPGSAVGELLVAANFLNEDSDPPKHLLKRLGEALLRLIRSRELVDSDRELATVAARVLTRADEPVLAAEAFERAGDLERTVELLAQAGDVERVERLLTEDAGRRQKARRETELLAEYESAMLRGRRDEALAKLRQLTETAKDKREPQRLLDALLRRLLTTGVIELVVGAAAFTAATATERVLCATPPILLGRGEECAVVLGDPGVSRQHVRLHFSDEGGCALTDLDSKNGTFLDGIQVGQGALLPLRHDGELGIGQHVRVQFRVDEHELSLNVRTGMRRGLSVRVSAGILPIAGRLGLRFEDGRPLAICDGEELRLNGQRVASGVQLLHGDVLEVGPVRAEVA
jgi:tetratricopeptide (TPR) repeat protein